MYIYDLFPNINLEDYETEFKGTIKEGIYEQDNKKYHYEYGWLKEFVAFSNTNGGKIFVGVDNNTHKIISYTHKEVDKLSLMIHRLVKQNIVPSISYEIKALKVDETSVEPRYILLVTVKKNDFIPVFLKQDGISVCYIRHFGITSIATPEEIVRLCYQNTIFSYDSLFSNEKYNINDFQTLNKYYKEIYNRDLDKKELISIGFIDQNNNLSNGALMFKDDFKNENIALIACTKFNGIDKGESIFLNNERFSSNLLEEFEQATKFIESNNDHGFKKLAIGQKEVFSYPKRAITEALINALAHRNYLLNNSQIEINIFKDRLEIISPGSLVSGKWLINEYNLKDIIPTRRNNVICSVFMMLKLMEERGSGFDKIEKEYETEDYLHQPFINADSNSVTITLPNLLYEKGIIKNSEAPKILVSLPMQGKNDYEILSYCFYKEKSITEIANFLEIKPSTYLRNAIKQLVQQGLLQVLKIDNSSNKYITNKEFVKLDY